MKVGHITDYLGKVIFEAKAPESGVVLFIRAVPSMDQRGNDREHRRPRSLNRVVRPSV